MLNMEALLICVIGFLLITTGLKMKIDSRMAQSKCYFRINRCIPSLSRRACEDAIREGRVIINGEQAILGDKVSFGDKIHLDGRQIKWENSIQLKLSDISINSDSRELIYLKYWKPQGVLCTTDLTKPNNIIKQGKFDLFPQRLFTVGRLDRDSSGLILLTSDGRINNALLNKSFKKEKHYYVEMDRAPSNDQILQLSQGVKISTPIQRDHGNKILTAKTLPCYVTRPLISPLCTKTNIANSLHFILTEGRNRQIRRMSEAVGLNVKLLHRTQFAGISLKGLKEGDWLELNEKEMKIIKSALKSVLPRQPNIDNEELED